MANRPPPKTTPPTAPRPAPRTRKSSEVETTLTEELTRRFRSASVQAENLDKNPALLPPQTSTKPAVTRDSVSCCSEKSIGAVREELTRRFRSVSLQVHQDQSGVQRSTLRNSPDVISDSDFRAFMSAGESFKKALQGFVSHLTAREDALKAHGAELQQVADVVDKTHKGVRIAGITGGATGAVGGAAAVAGVLLAPITMGASLAVTAIGVGVAAAGGVTGASAAITNSVKKKQVRKKVESVLSAHQSEMKDMESHLTEIRDKVEQLCQYDLVTLKRVNVRSAAIVKLLELTGGTSTTLGVMHRSTGVIEGFAIGMDLFFTEEDSQKLKKESKSRFAQQICEVAKHIEENLKELLDMREKLRSEGI